MAANDADSRILTVKKNFILTGARMMMMMVSEFKLSTTIDRFYEEEGKVACVLHVT
jgi:hypothetical protein